MYIFPISLLYENTDTVFITLCILSLLNIYSFLNIINKYWDIGSVFSRMFSFMQNSMKITYIFLILCAQFICYKIILWFLDKVQISTTFKESILNILFISFTLAWNGNHFALCKGNNSLKTYNLKTKAGIWKRSILYIL
jgi:hypothetical protein